MLKTYVVEAAEIGSQRFVMLSGPDPGEAAALAAALRANFPGFGLLYDIGHMPLLDETPLPALTTLKAHLAYVYVGNCVKVPGRPCPGFSKVVPCHAERSEASPYVGPETLRYAQSDSRERASLSCQGKMEKPCRPCYGALHPRFGFPGGESDVPQLAKFIRALFTIGYLRENPLPGARPWVGFEVRPQADETSAAILANIKRAWREAWVRV